MEVIETESLTYSSSCRDKICEMSSIKILTKFKLISTI